MSAIECKCMNPPFSYLDYDSVVLDASGKSNADIEIETCKHCGTKWLRYYYENAAFTASGRWYRGIVSDADLSQLNTSNAIEYLERLPWYFYGGSYFNSTGAKGQGKVQAT